jgi:hypothetical protein
MSLRPKDAAVGYKNPPQQTRWKKGQCGNPKRQYRRAPRGTVALIDEAFAEQIDVIEDGESKRLSVFEAILLQLWKKEMAGDKRATTVRLQYQDFVERRYGKPKPEFIIEHQPRIGREDAQSDGI